MGLSAEPGELDLIVVGAGPTAIALGAEAKRAGLSTLLVDRGSLLASLLDYPIGMRFFTTRERLEIADLPFAVPDDRPSREQALVYYQAVVAHYGVPVAPFEEVVALERVDGGFVVRSRPGDGQARSRRARAVAVATGYFVAPRRLGVPGEKLPWVRSRYREPLEHFGRPVLVVGGGNSAAEAALDLFRAGARVTLVHRGESVKPTVKYWLKPDLENRIAEGAIAARFSTRVRRFADGAVELESPSGVERLEVDRAYVLVGYLPPTALLAEAGVRIDRDTLEPAVDPTTLETDVPGLFVAGTSLAGRDTGRIFIENSRHHGRMVVAAVIARLGREGRTASSRGGDGAERSGGPAGRANAAG